MPVPLLRLPMSIEVAMTKVKISLDLDGMHSKTIMVKRGMLGGIRLMAALTFDLLCMRIKSRHPAPSSQKREVTRKNAPG